MISSLAILGGFWLVMPVGVFVALGAIGLFLEHVMEPFLNRLEQRDPAAMAIRPHRYGRLVRVAAYEQLLQRRDERCLARRRGHHLTQPGKRERFATTWLPATRVWAEHRYGALAGVVEGWHPAMATRRRARLYIGARR